MNLSRPLICEIEINGKNVGVFVYGEEIPFNLKKIPKKLLLRGLGIWEREYANETEESRSSRSN